MVWSEHGRVNIDVFGRRLVLQERLHHLVETKAVVIVSSSILTNSLQLPPYSAFC